MKILSKNLSLLLLFLFAMNFYNLESRILLIVFVGIVLLKQKWILPITTTSIILGCFSLLYYGFAIIYNPSMLTYYVIPFLLGPFMGYSLGILLIDDFRNDYNKGIKVIIYVIVFGRFLHGLLNFFVSNGYTGYMRNGMDFWTKSVIAATGQGALMTMAISLLFYAIFILKKEKRAEKILVILTVVCALMNSILSASRTAMIIMFSVFCLCVILFILLSNEERGKKRKTILKLIVIVGAVAMIYHIDAFGVKTYWESTPLFERINTESSYELGDKNRKEMLVTTIKESVDRPFGNGDMSATAHNLWLDILRQTGWMPFILLIIFTGMIIKKMFAILKKRTVPSEIKYLLFSVVLGALMNFAVEPIMKGMPYYFVAFCVIAGAMERYLVRVRLERR